MRKEILPQDLYEYYVAARADTYASGKKPITGLNTPGFKSYQYHQETSPYFYQDNYCDDEARPGNFGGFEIISEDSFEGKKSTFYNYTGGLTGEGLRLGESAIYAKLVHFLSEHISDVRFGKNVRFDLEDESGKWVYQGQGTINDWGWEDDETIVLNGVGVYKLRGTGICFIPGF